MIKDILISMAATVILEAIRLPDVAEVGKVTDTLPIKGGSRVSEYWAGNYELTDYTGRPKRLTMGEADATDICLRYGLHSIEFGNWVNENERQNALVAIDESLADLAAVIGAPSEEIGLNGTLAIAYGARGKGGRAAAHYHPTQVLINITKTVGAGTLAHEYGHAIDYHMGKTWRHAPSGGRALHRRLAHVDEQSAKGMMQRVFRSIFRRQDGKATAWIQKLEEWPDYWRRRNEIWARIFEQWVRDELKAQGKRNYFLTDAGYPPPAYLPPNLAKKAAPMIKQYARVALQLEQPSKPVGVKDKAMNKKLRDALNDVRQSPRFAPLSKQAAALLWLTWNQDPGAAAEVVDEYQSSVLRQLDFEYLEYDDDYNYILTDRGRDFLRAVTGRLQTFQSVADGTDLFPEDAGIASVEGPDIDTAFI